MVDEFSDGVRLLVKAPVGERLRWWVSFVGGAPGWWTLFVGECILLVDAPPDPGHEAGGGG